MLPSGPLPDWSATVAAIDRGTQAMAIIDRAGRLACANARFADCFGIGTTPPRLGSTAPRRPRRLRTPPARLGAMAGRGRADQCRWQRMAAGNRPCRARRTDYLVWRFEPLVHQDLVEEAIGHFGGRAGCALAREGIMAAGGRAGWADSTPPIRCSLARAVGDAEQRLPDRFRQLISQCR